MRTAIYTAALLITFTTNSFASVNVVKECTTLIRLNEETIPVEMNVKIIQKNDLSLYAQVISDTQVPESITIETANIKENKVRSGLNGDIEDMEHLNLAEKLITHALALTEDPILNGFFTAGLDLRSVRSAKIYSIGAPTSMGAVAIVEAKDATGKNLGSFLGGFLVTPCK